MSFPAEIFAYYPASARVSVLCFVLVPIVGTAEMYSECMTVFACDAFEESNYYAQRYATLRESPGYSCSKCLLEHFGWGAASKGRLCRWIWEEFQVLGASMRR